MRPFLPLVALALCSTLTGCFSFSQPPRVYTYDVNLRNTTRRSVSIELLRVDSTKVTRTRCDLPNNGFYTNRFTTLNDAEYLEARIRYLDEPESAPRHITELQRSDIHRDIIAKDNRLLLADRPNSIPTPE